MTAGYVSPTAGLRCVSAAKAAEFADRLQRESGCPATSNREWVTAPIDNVGFVFHLAEIAVAEGYASDSAAVSFQSAGIDLAAGRRRAPTRAGAAPGVHGNRP